MVRGSTDPSHEAARDDTGGDATGFGYIQPGRSRPGIRMLYHVLMCLGIPGEILDIREEKGLRFARVRFGGITRNVCLEYLPEADVGDFVVVHVGFAISTIDPEEARKTYELLESLGETEDLKAALDEPLDEPGEAS